MNRRWVVVAGAGMVALLVLVAPEPAASLRQPVAALQACGGQPCP